MNKWGLKYPIYYLNLIQLGKLLYFPSFFSPSFTFHLATNRRHDINDTAKHQPATATPVFPITRRIQYLFELFFILFAFAFAFFYSFFSLIKLLFEISFKWKWNLLKCIIWLRILERTKAAGGTGKWWKNIFSIIPCYDFSLDIKYPSWIGEQEGWILIPYELFFICHQLFIVLFKTILP